MSMLLMVKAMNTKVGNSSRKLVLIKLADHANDKGVCWPSYDYIAEQCEMSKRTVMRHIEELENQGLVKVTQRKRDGEAFNKSNLYFLSLNDGDKSAVNNENDGDNLSNDGDNLSKTMVTQCHSNQSLRTSHKKEPINKKHLSSDDDLASPKKSSIDFDLIKNAYNDAVEGEVFKTIKTINTARKNAVKKLIKESGIDNTNQLIDYFYDFAEKAPDWVRGKTSLNFTAHFDYIVRVDIYTRFVEGSL